jgi:molybdopterin biosynthesis enzyme
VIAAREDVLLRQIVALLERLVGLHGGELLPAAGTVELASVLANHDAHVTVVVGGSGSGRDDRSVQTLASVGRVDVHGIAIGPGHTSALGAVGDALVLVVPGRIDAALAAWLLVGVPLMRRLTGAIEDRPRMAVTLARKVTSAVGLLELVPVRVHEEKALPLASGYLPLHALSQANAYIVVPAESEGYPEGATVNARIIP